MIASSSDDASPTHSASRAQLVLLVCSDARRARRLRRLLTSRGYAVAAASSTRRTLGWLKRFDAPVVLMDLGLKQDALDFLSRVLSARPETQCIMVAAQARGRQAIAAMRLGAYDCIEKRSPPDVLCKALRQAFEHYEHRREQTQAAQRLQEQNQRLDTALQHMSQGLCMFDAEGKLVLCNDRYLELYGLTRDTAKVGMSIREILQARLLSGTFSGDLERAVAEALDDVVHGRARTRSLRLPGERWIRTVRRPVAGGGWVTTQEDIADQRRIENERNLSQTFLHTVIESIPVTVVVKDAKDLRYVLVNRAAEEMHGVSRDEMIGKTAHDLFSWDHASSITAHDREVMRSGKQLIAGEHLHETIRNGMRIVASKKLAITDENGNGKYLLGVVDDITDRKRAEAAERRNAEVLAATIASMADAVIVFDENGQALITNPAAVRLFGDRPDAGSEEWIKAYPRFLPDGVTPFPPNDLPISRVLRGEAVHNVHVAVRSHSGGLAQLVVNGRPLQDASGARTGAVIVYRDITETRATERQLLQAQKMDAIGQLTGGIAHDFNNILTVITSTIEILAEALADQPKLAAIANMIDEAAERGSELTCHLLAFARKHPLRPRWTDVNAVIMNVAKLLRPTLGAQVEIESLLADDSWPALVDSSQLTTALLNLAVNARDAMPDGGKLIFETDNVDFDEACARVDGEVTPGSYVMIAVTDTGAGILGSIRDQVFEPFFTTKGIGNGTGLGLSMVYGFVKQSGGHVRLFSEMGQGTTVKIYLPRTEGQAAPISERSAAKALVGGRETILVVEDDEPVRANVCARLQSLGYTTYAASNAEQALSFIESAAPFDLLFTDIIMPGVTNGWQLAELARQRRPGTKVLFTSGYADNRISACPRAGVLLLQKPYRKADLACMVREALDSEFTAASFHIVPAPGQNEADHTNAAAI